MPTPQIDAAPGPDAAASFETSLTRAAARVDQVLDRAMAREADGSAPERVVQAMRHALLGGGKRFRPFLVYETAALMGTSTEPSPLVDATATALECIHAYSLVHDDLPSMDNDRLRRGKPTVWVAFDEATAVLAGDALLTLAFQLIASSPGADPGRQLRLVRDLAIAAGARGMVGGQQLDLDAERRPSGRSVTVDAQADAVRQIQSMKTGALIKFGATAGAIAAGASDADVERLARYGTELGLAFQISDDLLDATGSVADVGKAVGKDADRNKATFVDTFGIDGARAELARSEAAAIHALAPFGDRARTLNAAARFMARRKS